MFPRVCAWTNKRGLFVISKHWLPPTFDWHDINAWFFSDIFNSPLFYQYKDTFVQMLPKVFFLNPYPRHMCLSEPTYRRDWLIAFGELALLNALECRAILTDPPLGNFMPLQNQPICQTL